MAKYTFKGIEREERKLFGVSLSSLLIVCHIAAFAGWCVENTFRLLSVHIFDSRHQMLPFLGAYGFGIFVLFFLLGTPTDMRIIKKPLFKSGSKKNRFACLLTYFSVIYVLIFFGEMSVGLAFEKFFGVQAWDYSDIPTHVTQYTSFLTTFGFATGITILMDRVFDALIRLADKIRIKIRIPLAYTLFALIVIDFLVMFITMCVTGVLPEYWSIRF